MITPTVLRINGADGDPIETADSPEHVERVVEGLGPGHDHVDEISADPLPCGHKSRRWWVGIKGANGTVVIEPDPWDA